MKLIYIYFELKKIVLKQEEFPDKYFLGFFSGLLLLNIFFVIMKLIDSIALDFQVNGRSEAFFTILPFWLIIYCTTYLIFTKKKFFKEDFKLYSEKSVTYKKKVKYFTVGYLIATLVMFLFFVVFLEI